MNTDAFQYVACDLLRKGRYIESFVRNFKMLSQIWANYGFSDVIHAYENTHLLQLNIRRSFTKLIRLSSSYSLLE